MGVLENAYLDRCVFVDGSECIGPRLYQLQHFHLDIFVWRALNELREHFTVLPGRDFIVNR